jgi:glycosyltransferase involved in cell wall biosynthesis
MMHTSVVLPIYLNRPHLPELYRRLTATLSATDVRYELVFVDDKGPDDSLEWLRACSERDRRVIVVEMPHNAGQHRAVLAGMQRSSGDRVVVMDADLQDPPEAIPQLIDALGKSDGVVFARRVARHQSRGRHLTGRLFKRLLRLIAGSRVPSGTGMFFVASRRVVDAACRFAEDARYVPLALDRTDAPMTAIDVVKEMRSDNRSAYTPGRRLTLALGAIRQAIQWRFARGKLRSAYREPRAGVSDAQRGEWK